MKVNNYCIIKCIIEYLIFCIHIYIEESDTDTLSITGGVEPCVTNQTYLKTKFQIVASSSLPSLLYHSTKVGLVCQEIISSGSGALGYRLPSEEEPLVIAFTPRPADGSAYKIDARASAVHHSFVFSCFCYVLCFLSSLLRPRREEKQDKKNQAHSFLDFNKYQA